MKVPIVGGIIAEVRRAALKEEARRLIAVSREEELGNWSDNVITQLYRDQKRLGFNNIEAMKINRVEIREAWDGYHKLKKRRDESIEALADKWIRR